MTRPSTRLSNLEIRTLTAAGATGTAVSGPLGAMPEWDLSDLYPGPKSPELARDLDFAATEAKRIKAAYQGRLVGIGTDGHALADAIVAYEQLSDLMGRIGSYAGLRFYGNMADPDRAKLYGDVQDKTDGRLGRSAVLRARTQPDRRRRLGQRSEDRRRSRATSPGSTTSARKSPISSTSRSRSCSWRRALPRAAPSTACSTRPCPASSSRSPASRSRWRWSRR